mmetsp:Transcript_57965/g.130668  ORF Transcript_57965/g.130668 Transcript_57965/m.130668 type:complete len:251 (-) Transcript_57965:176-928(-)
MHTSVWLLLMCAAEGVWNSRGRSVHLQMLACNAPTCNFVRNWLGSKDASMTGKSRAGRRRAPTFLRSAHAARADAPPARLWCARCEEERLAPPTNGAWLPRIKERGLGVGGAVAAARGAAAGWCTAAGCTEGSVMEHWGAGNATSRCAGAGAAAGPAHGSCGTASLSGTPGVKLRQATTWQACEERFPWPRQSERRRPATQATSKVVHARGTHVKVAGLGGTWKLAASAALRGALRTRAARRSACSVATE